MDITGRNLTINGYNYMIRHSERIVKVLEEANKIGNIYDRNDSDQFTNQLIRNILFADGNYIYTVDEGPSATIPILKIDNILSSPINQWIPKIQGDYVQLASIMDEILDYSGALLTVNFADDQLVLYDPEQVTSATGTFMVTNTVNKLADEVNTYNVPARTVQL